MFEIGKCYLIRTVTYFQTGRVVEVKDGFVILEDAAWIGDTGRFMNAIEKGTLYEVEPVTCKVGVNISNIIDVYEWRHDLPREQK